MMAFYHENGFPPFEKRGPGGISKAIFQKNPPLSPFSKGGGIVFAFDGECPVHL
jgi:hypothetical protein